MPTLELSILNLLILFGSLQGLILALILLTTKRLRKKSNCFLALLLFSLALLNLISTLEIVVDHTVYPTVRTLPLFLVNLIPVSIFFFIKYLINPHYVWRKWDYLYFVPFIIEFGHRFFFFIYHLRGLEYTASEIKTYYIFCNTYEAVACIATIGVIAHAIKKLQGYEKDLYENYAEVEDKSLWWLRHILIAGVLLSFFWSIITLLDFDYGRSNQHLAMYTLLGLSVLIYYIGYSMIIKQGLLDTPIFAVANKKVPKETAVESEMKEGTNGELSSKTDEHYIRIKRIIEETHLYRDPALNMSILSEKTGLSNGYLSQIINQKQKQNFFDFINGYRVEEVKQHMTNPAYEHYTLLGLAQEAGFKSKSTFNSVFKKMTGKTPSEYKKSA